MQVASCTVYKFFFYSEDVEILQIIQWAEEQKLFSEYTSLFKNLPWKLVIRENQNFVSIEEDFNGGWLTLFLYSY